MSPHLLLVLHAAATLFMWGVIAVVQVVHYPLFALVGREGFPAYAAAHARLITLVVGPAMLLEAATGLLLMLARPAGMSAAQAWLGLGLIAAIWLSTLLLQVPRHRQFGGGYDEGAHRFLVASNWVRTAGWTARALLVLWVLVHSLGWSQGSGA